MSPEEVSRLETIFDTGRNLRWGSSTLSVRGSIGVSLRTLLRAMAPAHAKTGSVRDRRSDLQRLLETYMEEKYLLWFDVRKMTVLIVVKEEAETESLLKAWAQALLLAHCYQEISGKGEKVDVLQVIQQTLKMVSKSIDECVQKLRAAGWDTDMANLETTSTTRLHFGQN